jgi:eukaryotic-like serine/threonine-protein kinase
MKRFTKLLAVLVVFSLALMACAPAAPAEEAPAEEAVVEEEAPAEEEAMTVEPTVEVVIEATEPSSITAGSTMVSEIDGMTMVYVPAGEFLMGSEDGENDESPVHTVYLDAYYIDQTEVTNEQYQLCVQAGNCVQPRDLKYITNSSYADHPVVYVRWNDANDYCQWARRQLPSEAQWEKAARGTDGRIYPWGEGIDCSLANYNRCVGETSPVGSYAEGVGPYGALDMAGNVEEWTADWFDFDYYKNSPERNPAGPSSGDRRVMRGGSWLMSGFIARSADRYNVLPFYSDPLYGFRCARLP